MYSRAHLSLSPRWWVLTPPCSAAGGSNEQLSMNMSLSRRGLVCACSIRERLAGGHLQPRELQLSRPLTSLPGQPLLHSPKLLLPHALLGTT